MSPKSRHVGKRLSTYREKRSASSTPEPFGGDDDTGARIFCVQKHAATRLHYDFRLEHDGVLLSWAVPKGPSYDPQEKRFAAKVEDHPVEYAGFEGIIPKDNYGAGEVILWDKGTYTPLEDFDEGLEKGKLLFELSGFKLRGVWTLVRIKGAPKDWLLIKHKDAFAGHAAPPETSILSGLTVEEMGDRGARAAQVRAELERLGARRRRLAVDDVELMLAELAPAPFSRPGWLFEVKYDGFRLLAARDGEQARLRYRRGADATHLFPDLARALAALPYPSLILDGEVVVHDAHGRPSFQRLQKRTQLERPRDIARAAASLPAVLHVFDLLAFEGFDLRPLPLAERKRLLARLVPKTGAIAYADHIERAGEAMFAEARRLGLEGLMAKRMDAPYRGGRSADWLKLRVERTGDFVVVGYTPPKGTRVGFGALHLAVHDGDGLVYAGRVGSGFSDAQLASVRQRLDQARVAAPPFRGPGPEGAGHVFCAPELIAECRFAEWTEEGQLRQPVFLRFRDDKRIEDCERRGDKPDLTPPGPPALATSAPPEVPYTNLDKVFWPEEGYTKGDLIAYYRAVAPWLLEYLRDRPVVMTRFPDGIHGKSFFQKDAPGFAPDWLRTERMWSEHASREINYFICDEVESLLYLANLGTIPLHVWASRVRTLERPDWCILDLDPKGAPFAHVVEVALAVRALCDELGLPSYPKTSGQAGLHVLVPLGRQVTFEQCKTIGDLLARVIAARKPDVATTARVVERRGGRVYVDWLQNGHGKLLAAPFSVRPLPGAPVSTPLDWKEVDGRLDPSAFTIKTVPWRMKRRKKDPLRPVLDEVPDLMAVLSRLAERL